MNIVYRNDYLLSSLPSLEPIGSIPPMSKSEFFAHVASSKGPVNTVEMILLYDDLSQYEALSSKSNPAEELDFAVLNIENAESEPVLPAFLLAENETENKENRRLAVDGIWNRYFRYAAQVAKSSNSGFLKAWVGFEVGLRNALAAARAQTLGLDPETYLVCPELTDTNIDYSTIISAWSAVHNPLSATETLDKARWDWLEVNGNWYSCSNDEIEAYAAKLILLHHWRRILSDIK